MTTAVDKLRIVHVVRQFAPGIGGLENFVQQLAGRQAAVGHAVRVVTLDRIFGAAEGGALPQSERMDGVEIVRVPYRGSQRYPVAPGVLKTIRDADIVHVHAVDFFTDFLALTRVLHRKPMVLTTHGGFFHTGFAQRLKRIYFETVTRASASRYGAVTACSVEDERTFERIVDARLKLIPNPVDVEKFAGLASPASKTMIYFGRLAPNKRVDRLLRWFAGFNRQEPGWRLIVAGKPMGVDLAELRQLLLEFQLGDAVEIHDTPSDGELRALIGECSVYLCASEYEGFGLAAIEAASAGLFPVLSNIPPFEHSVERLGFGMTVDFAQADTWPQSYRAFANGFRAFSEDAASDLVSTGVQQFDWAGSAPRFESLYRDVLGQRRRRIGGLAVDVFDEATARSTVLGAVCAGQPLMVAFCNAHSVNLAARDAAFRSIMEEALVFNDGVGVDLASRALFGRKFPDNLNGTDFVPGLLSSATTPIRLFLVGARPGVAEQAGAVLASRSTQVEVVGTAHGFFEMQDESVLSRRIAESRANLVLVAMGQPRQELWAQRNYKNFAGPTLCVGALLDFLAGEVPRAPQFVRKIRLEWLFRLFNEPRRLAGRYLVGNIAFLTRITSQWVKGRRA